MNKHILAKMVIERLQQETSLIECPLPEQIKTITTDHLKGRVHIESALYQADKLKKISISNRVMGTNNAGTVVMIIADDAYDLPFILMDIAIDAAGSGSITAGFKIRPLVADAISTQKYIRPFSAWLDGIKTLPAAPVHLDVGSYLKDNPAPLDYRGTVGLDHNQKLLAYTNQFIDILLDIYHTLQPVEDAYRRTQMDAFRQEYNRNILGTDYSGKMLVQAFGQQTAEIFYEHLVYL
ncbi:hypothetical protein ACFL43_00805 [Thermodesulfobacteriota bacterium]